MATVEKQRKMATVEKQRSRSNAKCRRTTRRLSQIVTAENTYYMPNSKQTESLETEEITWHLRQ